MFLGNSQTSVRSFSGGNVWIRHDSLKLPRSDCALSPGRFQDLILNKFNDELQWREEEYDSRSIKGESIFRVT